MSCTGVDIPPAKGGWTAKGRLELHFAKSKHLGPQTAPVLPVPTMGQTMMQNLQEATGYLLQWELEALGRINMGYCSKMTG